MDELITLTNLLHSNSPKNYFTINKNLKSGLLYTNIINGKIVNNNTGKKILYGAEGKNINSYNTLKSRYTNKLIFEIGNLNFKNSLSLIKKTNELEILDYLKISLILDTGFSTSERTKLLELILKKSIKNGDVDLVLMVLQQCYLNTAWINNNTKYNCISALLIKYKEFYDHKILALKIFTYFGRILLNEKIVTKIKLDDKIVSDLFSLKNSKTPDYNTKMFIYSSFYYYYIIKFDLKKLKLICKQALKYFEKILHLNKYGYYSFSIKYAYVLMFEKNYPEAKKFFDMMLNQNISKKQSIWLNINLYAIKNLIYLSNYKEATLRLLDVTRHKDYEKIKTPFFMEIYKIKEAYLNVLYKMKKFNLDDDSLMKKKPFRINKFLNEVPVYSKDKQGSNISILIIHIFYLFINKKYDLILNRLESLKAYSHRYLRNDDSLRSNAFIKILLQLPGSKYHPIAFERHSAKYYDKMINAPVHLAARHIEVEVIPYEKQYEILTDLLQMRLNQKI